MSFFLLNCIFVISNHFLPKFAIFAETPLLFSSVNTREINQVDPMFFYFWQGLVKLYIVALGLVMIFFILFGTLRRILYLSRFSAVNLETELLANPPSYAMSFPVME